MYLGGSFRVRLIDEKVRAAARAAHPDWDRERLIEKALVSDTGWKKNVVTDFARRYIMINPISGALAIMVHRATNPANVRRTGLQYVYPNINPLPLRAPDSQTNDASLQLQTRTVEFPVVVETGTGDSLSAGPTQTVTDAGGQFSPEMVGNDFTISGALNGGNNGPHTVASYISPTQITISNASGVSETSAFSWSCGVTRTIAMVGLVTATGDITNALSGQDEIRGILAYTLLSSPVIQGATQVADVQYRLSFSLD